MIIVSIDPNIVCYHLTDTFSLNIKSECKKVLIIYLVFRTITIPMNARDAIKRIAKKAKILCSIKTSFDNDANDAYEILSTPIFGS